MSHQHDRDLFIREATLAGLALHDTLKLMRYATTLQRLAEAQCNGDWPYDNGERKVETCPQCEAGCVSTAFKRVAYMSEGPGGRTYYKRICPDCYAQEKVTAILQPSTLRAVFGGDPRGAVLRLVPVNTTHDDEQSGRVRGIYVPARSR